jgi:hypothetical protein
MKRAVGCIVLMLLFASQIHCILIAYNPYMVAHFDNHRDAYIYWRQAYQKCLINEKMTLVHFDAHHDMDCLIGDYYDAWLSTYHLPPEEVKGFTNATFIDAAVNEGLVSEIWWVMPDYMYWGEHFDQLETFEYRGEPRQFYKYVRFCDCEREQSHIVCTMMDVHEVAPPLPTLDTYTKTDARVHFVTLDMLPHFDKEVLLDIDTDYFINFLDIERYPDFFYKDEKLNPWTTVDTFMEGITRIQIRSRVVTIAISPAYTHKDYHYLSWVVAERVNEYLSKIYHSGTFVSEYTFINKRFSIV